MFLSLDRIGHILHTPTRGVELQELNAVVGKRDEVSHRFLEDDMTELKSIALRPTTRIMHRTLMHTILPHIGSYELVYPNNYKALYAIWGEVEVNWPKLILDEFLTFNQGRINIIYFGEYIMWLLMNLQVPISEFDTSVPKTLNSRTISLMKLPPRPLTIISFQEWKSRPRQETSTQQQHQSRDDIRMPTPSQSTRESIDLIVRNQVILDSRIKNLDKKIDKKFDKIKSFFGILWDAISCSSSTATETSQSDPGKRPAPHFTWSTSEEHTSSDICGNRGRQFAGSSSKGKGPMQVEEEETESDSE